MVGWKPAAAIAVFIAAAMVGGAAVRLVGVADTPEALLSLGGLFVAVVAAGALGARARRLETAYW